MTANPPDAFAARDRLLSWRQVRDLAGLSRTTAWRLQNAGAFPRPVAISPGRVAWRESDVAAWKARLAPRTTEAPHRQACPSTVASASAEPAAQALANAPKPPARAAAPRRRPPAPANQMSFDF